MFASVKGQTLGVNPQTLSAVLHLWDPCNGILQVLWLSYQFLLSGRVLLTERRVKQETWM